MAGYTLDHPVTWNTLLASNKLVAGDTVVLKDGVYSAGDFKFSGVDRFPTILKAQHPGKVTIDGPMDFNGSYVSVYDIDFIDSNPDRRVLTDSILVTVGKVSFYGCHFKDQHTSGLQWFGSGVGNVCECLFENNGNIFPDNSKHGHGLYTHNNGGGSRYIARNLFRTSFGKYALHIYSDSNALKDYTCEDNVTELQPTHTGGPGGLTNFVYRRNIQWGGYIQHGRYGPATNGVIADNIMFGISSYYVNPDWVNLQESGNIVYGEKPAQRSGYDNQPMPKSWSRFIQFSISRRWKGIQVTLLDGVFGAELI